MADAAAAPGGAAVCRLSATCMQLPYLHGRKDCTDAETRLTLRTALRLVAALMFKTMPMSRTASMPMIVLMLREEIKDYTTCACRCMGGLDA